MASDSPSMQTNRSHITYSNHTHSALCTVTAPSVHKSSWLAWGSQILAIKPSLSEGPGQATTASCVNSTNIISLFQTFQVSFVQLLRFDIMLIKFMKVSVTLCASSFIQTTLLHRHHHQGFQLVSIPSSFFPGIKFGIGKGKTMVRRT